jgi:ketosteroid isomerase-like protein
MTTQTLTDRIEIQELTARYNRAADGTDPDALLAVFTGDATVEMHGGEAGPAEFVGPELVKLLSPAQGQRVHMTMDSIVEIAGDTATQECSLLLVTRAPRRGITAMFTGRYLDELVRTPDGWRFARRVVHVDYANEARMALANVVEGERV